METGVLIGDEVVPVIPRPEPKYLRFGPELTVLTGVTKRIPSAEATSPPPQYPASGSVD